MPQQIQTLHLINPGPDGEGRRSRHSERKIAHLRGFTHQALPLHAHVIRGDVDTGGSVSDHLGQADVEAIAGGSAGQLALLVRAHCKITRGGDEGLM